MLLFLFVTTCLSFILFSKDSLSLEPLPLWATEMRLLSLWFWKDLSSSIFSLKNSLKISSTTTMLKVDQFGEGTEMSVLDLPELVLECILEKLPPSGLCSMAGVSTSLRDRCMSDHLWEKHMKQKWGRIIGPAACKHWHCHINMNIASTNENDSISIKNCKQGKQKVWMKLLSLVRSFSFAGILRPKLDHTYKQRIPVGSIMSWYLAIEAGRFWFPAQVYNRENGHGFMLSCYDAELSYDRRTDSFQARYPPHGRRVVAIEHGVSWERLRAPPVDTSSHHLHISDCLNDLYPGDHIEIQWRRNKEFPYGWWYGVVGHLELCDGNENYCRCHNSDTVVLEFNQYMPGSRWRRTTITRKDHREEGNEADGFYGGIRKLKSKEEISTWKRLWPAEVLE